MAARIRPFANPDFCKKGSDHPSAKVFPLESSSRHLSMYDPASGKFTLISTCFPTHHVIFAEDANNTLWVSSGVSGPTGIRLTSTRDETSVPGGSRSSCWKWQTPR